MTTERRPRRRRLLLAVAAAMVVVLGRYAREYSAPPSGPKDCAPLAPRSSAANVIDDVSCLNPTTVQGIVTVRTAADVSAALDRARREGLKVSIAGARHSQGGHAFATNNLVLDMRGFKSVSVDAQARTITVQSGATWHDIQNQLHPRFAVKAMQSTDLFTVGGSISVNAHGMDHRSGSVGRTVRRMRVMLADGTVMTAGRDENSELFHLVVGGYGLFGVILDADIEIAENDVYRSSRRVMQYGAFPSYFENEVLRDPSIQLLYGHLSTAPSRSFLREMLVYAYQRVERRDAVIPPLAEVRGVGLRRLIFNASKLGGAAMWVKWWAEKHVEPMLESCPVGEDDGCLVSRNDPMHDSVPYLMNRLKGETDILQEYFIPRERFVSFIDGLRGIVREQRVNILNASVRVVHREDNVLTYAPADMFAVVLYVNQKTDGEGHDKMVRFTRSAIDLTLDSGGRFFLPYQTHYTPEQLRRSYPEVDAFFRAKLAYDPGELFTNAFYNKYRR